MIGALAPKETNRPTVTIAKHTVKNSYHVENSVGKK